MTESEWLASNDPARMLEYMTLDQTSSGWRHISNRKLRLFACAVARQVWDRLTDDLPCPTCDGSGEDQRESTFGDCPDCSGTGRINRSRRAVEVAERYVDGLASAAQFNAACQMAGNARRESPYCPWNEETPDQQRDMAAMAACELFQPSAMASAQNVSRLSGPKAAQAVLLREIVGNPFRPVTLPPGPVVKITAPLTLNARPTGMMGTVEVPGPCPWLTHDDGKVAKIARVIYDERRWDLMPMLADALEEAGCDNEEMLRHCRGQELREADGPGVAVGSNTSIWRSLRGPHVRGCWVIDLLLGKV